MRPNASSKKRSCRATRLPLLAKLTPNELYLQVEKAGAIAEVMIPFNELSEIKIRPKDAA